MKTAVLRKMGYSGTFIYVLQYEYVFQYLFAWNNEIYRQEIKIVPEWYSWRKWAWVFSLVKHPYTQEQLTQGEQVMISGAMKSIESLKLDADGSQRKEAEKQASEVNSTNSDCQWQARTDLDGKPMLLCLTHNKSSLLQNNPKHD